MSTRYPSFLIALHWLMALAVIGMLASGFIMNSDLLPQAQKFNLFQLHKASGIILMLAVLVRLGARFMLGTPPMPETLPTREKTLAKLGHLALYGVMFAMPFAGWVMVSSSAYGIPTMIYGLFQWPHLPFITNQPEISEMAEEVHEILALVLIGIVGVHIAAVIKHARFDKINLLRRMWWS